MIRNLILFLVIGGAISAGFYFFSQRSSPGPINTISSSSSGDIYATTSSGGSSLSGIRLDTSIFSSPAFQSLRDSSIILIQKGNQGRPNPFAPIGFDNPLSSVPTNSIVPADEEF